jgi:hypothetical protein
LAVVVTIAVLSAAGALPVRMLAGWRPVTPFLAPIGGAVLASTAGELTVLADGTELGWFVPLAVAVNSAATASWLARREARRSRTVPKRSIWMWTVGTAGVLGVAAATAWCIRSVASQGVGVQARGIWLVHASWIVSGHKDALAALKNPALAAAHSTYPPLGSASVALGWAITNLQTPRVGQLVLAVLTGCAVAAAGMTAIEVGLVVSVRSAARRALLSRDAVLVVSAAAGVAWVLGAYGLAGASAVNGSVDLLWASAAVGAAGLGLVLPHGGERARGAAVLVVAAGMTKEEGIVAAVILFGLIGLRWLVASTRKYLRHPWRISRRRGLVAAIACAFGIAGVLAWPIGVTARRGTRDDEFTGARAGSLLSRADSTWHSFAGALHIAGLALAIGIVAEICLGRRRRALGLGSDRWLWALGVAEMLVIGGAYVVGTKPVGNWLSSSIDRTSLFAGCLGLALLAWWCITAVAVCVAPRGDQEMDPASARERVPAGDVDGVGSGVLHPRS